MSRKRYASDKNTTTLRVKKPVASGIRKLAKRARQTVFVITGSILSDALIERAKIQ